MKKLAFWAWMVVFVLLTIGHYFFWWLLAEAVLFLLVWWLRPEWIDKP